MKDLVASIIVISLLFGCSKTEEAETNCQFRLGGVEFKTTSKVEVIGNDVVTRGAGDGSGLILLKKLDPTLNAGFIGPEYYIQITTSKYWVGTRASAIRVAGKKWDFADTLVNPDTQEQVSVDGYCTCSLDVDFK